MKREVSKVFLMLFLLVILSSGILAVSVGTCDIVERSACDNPATEGYVLMGVSDLTNAHAELASEGNYDYVLCCNSGAGDTTCASGSSNKILGLSSSTNAHVEEPSQSNYEIDICYEDFDCIASLFDCGEEGTDVENYPLGLLSLTSETNAHVGKIDDYDVKICCGGEVAESGDCILESAEWNLQEAVEGQKVYLQIIGNDDCDGSSISFEVREMDLVGYTNASVNPVSVSFNGDTATGVWYSEWVDDGALGGDPEYAFYAALSSNPGINIASSDPKLSVTQQDAEYCGAITTCTDYSGETECISDSCERASESSLPEVDCNEEGIYCGCAWDSETESCDFAYTEILQDDCGTPTTGCNFGCTLCYDLELEDNYCNLGATCPSGEEPQSNNDSICDIGEGCSSEDCGDGDRDSCESPFYCLSGKCSSIEDVPLSLGTCNIEQTIESDCDEDPIGYKKIRITGTWTGDECGAACEKCQSMAEEEIVIPCPAQIQLPFFGPYSIVLIIVVIIFIYILFRKRKKKGKKNKF